MSADQVDRDGWLSHDRLLNSADVAGLLGVPASTLTQWRHLCTGPAYMRVGRHVRYRQTDIEAWLLSQRRVAHPTTNHNQGDSND